MKIKKIGHCCLVIEINRVRILTDPGAFTSDKHKDIKNIDFIFITHEHGDHLHTGSLKEIIDNNPNLKIITNSSVGKILESQNIKYEILENKNSRDFNGINVEAFDAKHEEIFEDFGQVQNTGYFFDNKLFYPGDAYAKIGKEVDILAMPVAGPWCKISDAIRYALEVKPNKVFPVHDGMLQKDRIGGAHKVPEKILNENGIKFIVINNGDEREF